MLVHRLRLWHNNNPTLTFTVRGSTLMPESDVCRRQIVTSKVDPCTERVKYIYNGRRPITYNNIFIFVLRVGHIWS